jgi:hypothetical protein
MKLKVGFGFGLALVLLILSIGSPPARAVVQFPHHRCGSFIVEDGEFEGRSFRDRVTVYNSDGLACRLATAVIEAFWDPDETHHHHGGQFDYNSWWTTDRYPSWRCSQGAGGGICRHKRKVAGYSVKNA